MIGSDRLSRFALRWSSDRSVPFQVVFVLAAMAVSSALRFAIDTKLPQAFPFLTFFPAITLTVFLAGPSAVAAVAVLTGMIARYCFIYPVAALGISAASMGAMQLFALIAATDIVLIHVKAGALRRMVDAEARSSALAASRSLMFNEVQHRVPNTMTTGSLGLSIARQFARLLGGRLSIRPRSQGRTLAELVFPAVMTPAPVGPRGQVPQPQAAT